MNKANVKLNERREQGGRQKDNKRKKIGEMNDCGKREKEREKGGQKEEEERLKR